MNYLTRNIDSTLIGWKRSTTRKPLLLRGARQIGKTATARSLCSTFKHSVEINFERQPELHRLFEQNLDPKRIIRGLELHSKTKIEAGKSILFFDEIQQCPKALSSLRYFYEEIPELHMIAAGSLLEFVLDEISFPVGRIHSEFMYPLSFTEYLRAMGDEALIEFIPHFPFGRHIEPNVIATDKLRGSLRDYFLVGGMPKAVSTYKETGSFLDVANIHEDLLQSYGDDIRKYAKGEKVLLNCGETFTRLFNQVGKQIKYSQLMVGEDVKRTKKSLQLLEQAMVIHLVRNVNPQGLPLGASANDKQFKIVFLDIGLGQRAVGRNISNYDSSDDLLNLYHGQLAEQFVGQQLLAESVSASKNRKVYFWMRTEKSASAEVDYLIVRNGKIIPIEVKSGKSGSLKSMHLFLKAFGGSGVCLQDRESIETNLNLSFAPIYTLL